MNATQQAFLTRYGIIHTPAYSAQNNTCVELFSRSIDGRKGGATVSRRGDDDWKITYQVGPTSWNSYRKTSLKAAMKALATESCWPEYKPYDLIG